MMMMMMMMMKDETSLIQSKSIESRPDTGAYPKLPPGEASIKHCIQGFLQIYNTDDPCVGHFRVPLPDSYIHMYHMKLNKFHKCSIYIYYMSFSKLQ